MKKWLFACLCLAASVHAALPPLAQSTKEILALLSDPRLQELLGSAEPVQQILRIETGYLIVTRKYALSTEIHYGTTHGLAAPIPFSFTFHEPVRLNSP